jgi:glycosyltransferase involved in cell wall biosynthesis
MRIAQIAPLQVAVPPKTYGGTERVVANLVEALVQLGHEVTLFASGDSKTSARLVAEAPKAFNFDPAVDAVAYHEVLLADVYAQADRFDIIHSHVDYLTLPYVRWAETPTVLTLHGRLDVPEYGRVFRAFPDVHYVSISKSQQSFIPDLNWAGTVYHSVDVPSFPFSPTPGAYLVFVGRIAPEKGPEHAINIAKRSGIPLKIAAKVDPIDQPYYEQVVAPQLDDPLIQFLGPVGEVRKRKLMANALALLLPIQWDEPFGVVFIEALACGTPVLTCPRGSVPELLRDGVTGYACETDEELVAAVKQVRHISREGCRTYARRRFNIRRMALDYVKVYMQVAAARERRERVQARALSALADLVGSAPGEAPDLAELERPAARQISAH